MIVMKFGGSSVANREQIDKVLHIVNSRMDRSPVVVSSAHKGITDALIKCARSAANGHLAPEQVLDPQRHIAHSLGCEDSLLDDLFLELTGLLRGISLIKELSPRSVDYISSFGERMSVRCIADYFTRNGRPAVALDIWDLGFITDENHGNARPIAGYESEMRKRFSTQVPPQKLAIVTGFIGKTRSGEITTVGRNGSDLTSTLIGSALQAEEVQIWTDTDGVMTADPSIVQKVHNIPMMRFSEAAELAYFGSRVLHPSTLLPAMKSGIPVRVLNTNCPEHHGTVIQEIADNPHPITSIAYKEKQLVVTVTATQMFGASGYLASIFEVLKRHEIIVDMISTSEISVSFTTNDKLNLDRALPELQGLGSCEIKPGKTILAIVGQNLAQNTCLTGEVLVAIANAGVRVEMVSYGMGSINFTMLIDDSDIEQAVQELHRVLFCTYESHP